MVLKLKSVLSQDKGLRFVLKRWKQGYQESRLSFAVSVLLVNYWNSGNFLLEKLTENMCQGAATIKITILIRVNFLSIFIENLFHTINIIIYGWSSLMVFKYEYLVQSWIIHGRSPLSYFSNTVPYFHFFSNKI